MRSSKSRSRNKSNRQRSLGNIVNRVFDSSGPEGKVRGTPQQIIEKYLTLARDAQLSNDRVAEQSFLQHAEHYTRMLGEAQREQAERQQMSQNRDDDGREDGGSQNGQSYDHANGNGQNGNGGQGNGQNGNGQSRFERGNQQRGEHGQSREDRHEQRASQKRNEHQPRVQEQALPDAIASDNESGLVDTPEAVETEFTPAQDTQVEVASTAPAASEPVAASEAPAPVADDVAPAAPRRRTRAPAAPKVEGAALVRAPRTRKPAGEGKPAKAAKDTASGE